MCPNEKVVCSQHTTLWNRTACNRHNLYITFLKRCESRSSFYTACGFAAEDACSGLIRLNRLLMTIQYEAWLKISFKHLKMFKCITCLFCFIKGLHVGFFQVKVLDAKTKVQLCFFEKVCCHIASSILHLLAYINSWVKLFTLSEIFRVFWMYHQTK